MTDLEDGKSYYIRVRGRVQGPFDTAALKVLRSRGQFSRANEVSADRRTWKSAVTIEHLLTPARKLDESQAASTQAFDTRGNAYDETQADWHFAIGTQQFGPVTLRGLQEAIAAKKLSNRDLVWRNGLERWTPLGEVAELTALRRAVNLSDALPTSEAVTADELERHIIVDIYKLAANLQSVGLYGIFPWRAWLRDRPLSLVWVQLLVFVFSFPLLLGQYYAARNAPLVEAAWALSLYFAVIGAAILHRCIRPEPLGIWRMFGVWLFSGFLGVSGVLLIGLLGSMLPFVRDAFDASRSTDTLGRLVGMTISVGFLEELAKAVPLLWIACRSTKPSTPNTGAFLGCLSGLAFGSTEAVAYSVAYAAGHAMSALPSYGDYILVQILRFVSLPLLHGIWSGIAGYFIFLSRTTSGSRGSMPALGLILVACLHGAYDTFIGTAGLGWVGAAIAMCSLILFVGYIRNEGHTATVTGGDSEIDSGGVQPRTVAFINPEGTRASL